jgi:hypothetical protein
VGTPTIWPPSMVNVGFESSHELNAHDKLRKTKKYKFFIIIVRDLLMAIEYA